MNSGKNVEFDHAHKLLQNEDGYFWKLVQEAGPVISKKLRDIACEAYQRKQSDLDGANN